MAGATKKRPQSPAPRQAHSKRRRGDTKFPEVTFNLTKNSQSSLGLKNPQFLKIHDIDYLSHISTSNEYLYEIVSRIFDVSIGSVKLYRQADGDWAPETDPLWRPVAATEEIMGGKYLCSVNNGKLYYKSSLTVGVLKIDPVFVSKGGGGSTLNSSASSRRGSVSPVVESTIIVPVWRHLQARMSF
jgi:hypothetical protein